MNFSNSLLPLFLVILLGYILIRIPRWTYPLPVAWPALLHPSLTVEFKFANTNCIMGMNIAKLSGLPWNKVQKDYVFCTLLAYLVLVRIMSLIYGGRVFHCKWDSMCPCINFFPVVGCPFLWLYIEISNVFLYCSFENNLRLEGPELLGLATYDTNCFWERMESWLCFELDIVPFHGIGLNSIPHIRSICKFDDTNDIGIITVYVDLNNMIWYNVSDTLFSSSWSCSYGARPCLKILLTVFVWVSDFEKLPAPRFTADWLSSFYFVSLVG